MKTITKKAYGKNIKITDARDNFDLAINNAYGNTEQDTTSGKNLLDCSGLTTQTVNGVTFTPKYSETEEDVKKGFPLGSLMYINANGTNSGSGEATYRIGSNLLSHLTIGTEYIMNGCPIGGSANTYRIQHWGYDGAYAKHDYGSGVTYTFNDDDNNGNVAIIISSGVTVSNLKFYPMIRLATITDGTYEPFTNGASPNPDYPQEIESVVLSEIKTTNSDGSLESVVTLSEPITLNGLNGAQDYVDVKRGVLVQKIKTVVLNGSESWSFVSNNSIPYFHTLCENFGFKNHSTLNYMCDCFRAIVVNDRYQENTMFLNDTGRAIFTTSSFATLNEWKEWLTSNNVTVVYELAEPIETPLPEVDVEALKSLKTYDGVTHIFTDSEVEPTLEVEYTLLEAKDDWNYADYILHTDYNRIVGNITYLKAYLDTLFIGLDNLPTMEEKNAKSLIYAREINAIETALKQLNLETYKFDIGETKEYLPNTRTLNFEDLNRIESAIFMLAKQMTSHKENLTRLAFTLGNQKGIRV